MNYEWTFKYDVPSVTFLRIFRISRNIWSILFEIFCILVLVGWLQFVPLCYIKIAFNQFWKALSFSFWFSDSMQLINHHHVWFLMTQIKYLYICKYNKQGQDWFLDLNWFKYFWSNLWKVGGIFHASTILIESWMPYSQCNLHQTIN